MALKFNCKNCGGEIVTKYLKPGEFYKCRACGAENAVPAEAAETDEITTYAAVTPGAPFKGPGQGETPFALRKKYPALRRIATLFKVLGWVGAAALVLFGIFAPQINIVLRFTLFLYAGLWLLFLITYAECIVVLMDIEENTRVSRLGVETILSRNSSKT
jgi:hypothetical protein